tara:strand:+ start:391 stop:549 length:159 start_codon:yes stop_codon:yes gene_type:complete
MFFLPGLCVIEDEKNNITHDIILPRFYHNDEREYFEMEPTGNPGSFKLKYDD